MHPTLGPRGKLLLLTALSFLVTGSLTGAVAILALGFVLLCALMSAYLAFFPTAILLRNRMVELSWWIPPGDLPGGALTRNRPFHLHVALRNHGRRALHVKDVRLSVSRGLDIAELSPCEIAAGHQVELKAQGRSLRSAYQVIHGARVFLADALGLFTASAYFPNPIAVRVFPQAGVPAAGSAVSQSVSAAFDRTGPHVRNQRGMTGDLREIREHMPGDAMKYVEWKATARKKKLMVKEFQTEVVLTHQILLDIGGSMRTGALTSKLDLGIELAASLCKSAIQGGDRIGLLTYDSRVFSEVKTGDGQNHYLRVLDRLIETQSVVDEDLTDITGGELAALLARYLAFQEAIEVGIPHAPPPNDPLWNAIIAGPRGDLYDIERLAAAVRELLRGNTVKSATGAWSPPAIGRDTREVFRDLRLFCQIRGIELPHRKDHARRLFGLEDALRRASSGARTDVTVIISDLFAEGGERTRLERALSSARHRGERIAWVMPEEERAPIADAHVPSVAARSAFAREAMERKAEFARKLLGLGVRFFSYQASDSLPALVARVRGRHGGRRAA
jgi:uncharacterized protein (DUF58 family)